MERLYESDVRPIEGEFKKMGAAPRYARELAWVVVSESSRAHINPWFTLAIIKVEDPKLDRRAVSFAGAIGIMQVMPRHSGQWGCGSVLTNVRTNVCTGTKIMATFLRMQWEKQSAEANRLAMLAYNGCVRTPGCESYADNVLGKTDFTDPADVWAKER